MHNDQIKKQKQKKKKTPNLKQKYQTFHMNNYIPLNF